MIQIIECAQLSNDVYSEPSMQHDKHPYAHFVDANELQDLVNKGKSGWARMKDVCDSMQYANHCYAQLYIKFGQQQTTDAVFAVRGTLLDDWNNIIVDLRSWRSDVMASGNHALKPAYLGMTLSYFDKARQYIDDKFPHLNARLCLTGHSLGGALAQLVVLAGGYGFPVRTFNAPGVGHMPGLIFNCSDLIYNINSRYGLINRVGAVVGHIFQVDVPQYSGPAKQLFDEYNLHGYEGAQKDDKNDRHINAFFERISMLRHSAATIKSSSEFKSLYEICMQKKPRQVWGQFQDLQNTSNHYGCNDGSLFTAAINIIKEQHIIKNMVEALYLKENINLALATGNEFI